MIIKIEKEDIALGEKAISNAIRRQHGIEASVDRKYIVFKGNEVFPRRLPLSAEDFQYKVYVGQEVEPFEFEVNG